MTITKEEIKKELYGYNPSSLELTGEDLNQAIDLTLKKAKEDELKFLQELYNSGFSNGSIFQDKIENRMETLKK